jgi:hypothetical protein
VDKRRRIIPLRHGCDWVAKRVEQLPVDWPDGRDVLLVELTDWRWPAGATVEWFTAFIAADVREASDEVIRPLATAMLAQRCAYVSAWGPACERIHAVFDEVYVTWPSHSAFRRWRRRQMRWSKEIPFLMTTDHHDESLPTALQYAVDDAWPSDDGYFENRRPTFVALVERSFREEVRSLLLNLDRLRREGEATEE